jgi:hypothetical protein
MKRPSALLFVAVGGWCNAVGACRNGLIDYRWRIVGSVIGLKALSPGVPHGKRTADEYGGCEVFWRHVLRNKWIDLNGVAVSGWENPSHCRET